MKISVYIPSYNQKDYLVEAIDSVLAQTLPAWEIIIVDDCSQDGSQELIAGYAARHPQIRAIYHTHNTGVAQTRIDALHAVTGDSVTYVDGDDRFLPTKLEKEAARMHASSAPLVYSAYHHIAPDGTRTGVWPGKSLPPQGQVFCRVFARQFPRGALFRHELVDYQAWRDIGFHDPGLDLYEDYEMRIRLTKSLPVAYVNEPLSEYRHHPHGLRNAPAEHKLEVFNFICDKNRALLDDLDTGSRRGVLKNLDRWRARLLRTAAKEALGYWNRPPSGRKTALDLYKRAWRIHRVVDPDLLLGLALPHGFMMGLRSAIIRRRRA